MRSECQRAKLSARASRDWTLAARARLVSDRTDALALDRRLVHPGGVEICHLPQSRLGAQAWIVLRELERSLELPRIAIRHFLEAAPARAIGGNHGAREPVAIHVVVEIAARPDIGVEIRDVER